MHLSFSEEVRWESFYKNEVPKFSFSSYWSANGEFYPHRTQGQTLILPPVSNISIRQCKLVYLSLYSRPEGVSNYTM